MQHLPMPAIFQNPLERDTTTEFEGMACFPSGRKSLGMLPECVMS
jgi:hypothetical protein